MNGLGDKKTSDDAWRRSCESVVDGCRALPFPDAGQRAKELIAILRQELAIGLQSRDNDWLQALTRQSHAERVRAIATGNAIMDELGVVPYAQGRPARLVADYRDDQNTDSRIRLELLDAHARRARPRAYIAAERIELRSAPSKDIVVPHQRLR